MREDAYRILPKPGGGCGIHRIVFPLLFEDAEGFARKLLLLQYFKFRNPHSAFDCANFFMEDTNPFLLGSNKD
jgi:hypothetical protein